MEETPITTQQMEIIGGGLREGRVMFKGLTNDHLVTTDTSEKNLLTNYRKFNRVEKERYVVDAEWILNNPKKFGLGKPSQTSRKKQKEKNKQKLVQMAKTIKKVTLRGELS